MQHAAVAERRWECGFVDCPHVLMNTSSVMRAFLYTFCTCVCAHLAARAITSLQSKIGVGLGSNGVI